MKSKKPDKNTLSEIPLWMKPLKLVWIEVRDSSGLDVKEYLKGTISKTNEDTIKVEVVDEKEGITREYAAHLIHERLAEHGIVDDLANIPLLNDAELLAHLEIRYNLDLIYCYCGPTLIAVNPYKNCPNESSPEKYEKILNALLEGRMETAPPHVSTISATAYDYLFKTGQNQAICISGESGAGKTECTKRSLAFITGLNQGRQSTNFVPIEQKIMACNPILEAFGNAKTFRNDNSSRFGKYTTLYIHKKKKSIKGAAIENYLLEKSRIVKIAKEERNYHIFYAMCRFFPKEKLVQYHLWDEKEKICDLKAFYFLNQSGIYTTPKVDDQEFYDDVNKAFLDLEFTKEEIDGVWRTLAAVLHLGNVRIDESTFVEGSKSCSVIDNISWKKFCQLLECDSEMMKLALTNKQMKNVGLVPLRPDMAKAFLYSLAKELYDKMFNWIVLKLNKTLLPDNPQDKNFKTIGVLDIFGFEIFDTNSLEQFFINYANERLQALYIEYIFKNEKKIFEEEGLQQFVGMIKFEDNADMLKALDGRAPVGVFKLMDQSCQMNKGDKYLYQNIKQIHKKSSHIKFPKFSKNTFEIVHTARDVQYCIDSFVEKNKDEISSYLEEAIGTSVESVHKIYTGGKKIKQESGEETPGKKTRKKKESKFLGAKFKKDMDSLINQLSKCYCHFIRCIKPNEFKRSNHWNSHLALMQIKYMGLLDSLKIRKQSFPFRYEYKKFYEIYQDVDLGEKGATPFGELEASGVNFFDLAKKLIEQCGEEVGEEDLLYGKTRVFMNEGFKLRLDKKLSMLQKCKVDSLTKMGQLFKTFKKRGKVEEWFQKSYNSIVISRDLLNGWTAKIEGMKFRSFQKIVRKLQSKFRLVQSKRQQRLKSHHIKIISRYLALYKFSKQVMYIGFYKRKVVMLQAMMDRQIRDGKNRFCRQMVSRVFEEAWSIIHARIIEQSVLQIQKTFRAHVLRSKYKKEYVILSKKIKEAIKYNAAVTIQKHIKGFLVRTRLHRLHRAAFKLQGYFRMIWMREYFQTMCRSARLIQKCYRKYFTKRRRINDKMSVFLHEFGRYNQDVNDIEYKILFGEEDSLMDSENINTFTKLPFYLNERQIKFGSKNYKRFVPDTPEIELQPKAKFVSLLIDVSINVDTTNVYPNTWAHEFLTFLRKVHRRNNRMLHLEIGETFTVAVTEDREVFSWGLNDFHQCGRKNKAGSFSLGAGSVHTLSSNSPRMLAAGKDHAVMVDGSNNVFAWGRNGDGQLGLEHARSTDCVWVLNGLKDKVKNLAVRGKDSYIVTEGGSVVQWPAMSETSSRFCPKKLSIPGSVKICNISLGDGFAMLLAHSGLLFSFGRNDHGQLGLGERGEAELIESPQLLQTLKNKNEKVVEIQSGFAHNIARTALNKVYTWGLNNLGQLGLPPTSTLKKLGSPKLLYIADYKGFRYKPRSIAAGLYCSYVLMDDRRLFRTGHTGQETIKTPTKFAYEKKFFSERMADDFTPLRIYCKWSRLMTATYILFADFRRCRISKTVREKFVDKINNIWNKNNSQLLPMHNDILAKHIWYKYLQQPNKIENIDFSHSGKSQMRGKTGHEWLTPSQVDQNKSQGIIDTGIDWENKKMKNEPQAHKQHEGFAHQDINKLALGTDEINFLKKAAPEEEQVMKDYERMKLRKSESPDQMEFDYQSSELQEEEPNTRKKKFSQRRSKKSSRSPNYLRSPGAKSPSKRSRKSGRYSKKSGSPSIGSHRTMSRRSPKQSVRSEYVEDSPDLHSRQAVASKQTRASRNNLGVKFADPEQKSISTFDQMFMEIQRLQNKPKKSLTTDEKSILRKWQQINK